MYNSWQLNVTATSQLLSRTRTDRRFHSSIDHESLHSVHRDGKPQETITSEPLCISKPHPLVGVKRPCFALIYPVCGIVQPNIDRCITNVQTAICSQSSAPLLTENGHVPKPLYLWHVFGIPVVASLCVASRHCCPGSNIAADVSGTAKVIFTAIYV